MKPHHHYLVIFAGAFTVKHGDSLGVQLPVVSLSLQCKQPAPEVQFQRPQQIQSMVYGFGAEQVLQVSLLFK